MNLYSEIHLLQKKYPYATIREMINFVVKKAAKGGGNWNYSGNTAVAGTSRPKPRWTMHQVAMIRLMLDNGESISTISEVLSVSKNALIQKITDIRKMRELKSMNDGR